MTDGPNEGTLVGTTGNNGPAFVFIEWYKLHSEHDFSEAMDDNQILGVGDDDEDFWCILLTPERKIFIGDRFFCPDEVEE
ncbi:MAG: hypothetical protein IH825_07725, partial [Candidatus Marinimicrobia bacterium]|nr:hypothetical protein [Candidatus Neomarinimicrobiota bacterium]